MAECGGKGGEGGVTVAINLVQCRVLVCCSSVAYNIGVEIDGITASSQYFSPTGNLAQNQRGLSVLAEKGPSPALQAQMPP